MELAQQWKTPRNQSPINITLWFRIEKFETDWTQTIFNYQYYYFYYVFFVRLFFQFNLFYIITKSFSIRFLFCKPHTTISPPHTAASKTTLCSKWNRLSCDSIQNNWIYRLFWIKKPLCSSNLFHFSLFFLSFVHRKIFI